MICRAGCSNKEILSAAGTDWSALFPDSPLDPTKPSKPERRPYIPAQVFEQTRLEIGVVAIIAGDLYRNRAISDRDYERLGIAVARLERTAEQAYGR